MAKRILIVDDSKTMRDMVSFTLREAGFEVTEAEDGKRGLDLLGSKPVDCIITDLNMPVMDGLTFIAQVRKNAVHGRTPILMLTTESDAAKKDAGRAAGATGWLVKPFSPDKLVATINKVSP